MEAYIEKLNELNKKNKLNKSDIGGAAIALKSLYNESDIQTTVNYLMRFNADVWLLFWESIEPIDDEIDRFITEVSKNELLSKKGNNYIFARILAMYSIFIKKDYSSQNLSKLAVKLIKYGEKQNGSGYNIEFIKAFQRYIVDEKISDKFWELKETAEEKNYFNRFKEAVERECSTVVPEQKKEQPLIENEKSENDNSVEEVNSKKLDSEADLSQVLDMVSLSHIQLESLLKSNFENILSELSNISHNVIDNYRSWISSKDLEIMHLKDENKEIRDRTVALSSEMDDLKQENEELKGLVDSLKEKLSLAYKVDTAAQNQELLVLKKNVSDSIRPEFEDYNSSGREFNEDNFLASCASIERIFKILKRFGFDL